MRALHRPILLAACLLAGCQQSSTTPSATANTDSLPAQQMLYGLHHVVTKDGIRSSVLDADTAYMHEGAETLFLSGVRLSFFAADGTESGTLTSRKGEYDPTGGLFVAREDVVLVTRGANGERRIETDELSYQVKSDELWSNQPFVMTENGRTTRGASFKSNGRFSNFSIESANTSGGLPTEETGISF